MQGVLFFFCFIFIYLVLTISQASRARSSSNRSFSLWSPANFHLHQTKPSIQHSEAFNEHHWTLWVTVVTMICQGFYFLGMLLLGWNMRAYLAGMQIPSSHVCRARLWRSSDVMRGCVRQNFARIAMFTGWPLLFTLVQYGAASDLFSPGRIYRPWRAVTLNTVRINDCCFCLWTVKWTWCVEIHVVPNYMLLSESAVHSRVMSFTILFFFMFLFCMPWYHNLK